MPCRDDGYEISDKEYREGLRKQVDSLTDSLCSACRLLEQKNLLEKLPTKVREWWEEHKKADLVREARERAEKAQQALKEKALAKLTQAEKRALGL